MITPMIIFEGQRFNTDWTESEVPGTQYAMSGKGWTDQELFGQEAVYSMLLDGHLSHYEPGTIRIAAEEGIIVLAEPPHLAHYLQSLDPISIGCSAVSVGPADEDGQEADFEELIDLTCSNEDAFDDSSV